MYLIDTNIISAARNPKTATPEITAFFTQAKITRTRLYLSAITIGELRRGAALIRHRGDTPQAKLLEAWLATILDDYAQSILPFDHEAAQLWAILGVHHPAHAIDKQIAAIALLHDLTIVTRNTAAPEHPRVRLLNPLNP